MIKFFSKFLRKKPIHSFRNTVVDPSYFKKALDILKEEWPASLQDCHEDEYLVVSSRFLSDQDGNEVLDRAERYLDSDAHVEEDTVGTRGIGKEYKYFHHYKLKNKSVFIIRQGTSNRTQVEWVIIAYPEFYENVCD